ncbi:MAG TPA: M1 family aminopeptidase [Ignavibacteriales bacterium]|nr:M1 family aminopeptidase [Ignavibacteriales bacterium]
MKKILIIFVLAYWLFAQNMDGAFFCSKKKIERYTNIGLKENLNLIQRNYDVLKYKITVDLRNNYVYPYARFFTGNVEIDIRLDSVAKYIELDANSQSITIDSIIGDVKSYQHSNNKLLINFNNTYLPEIETKLKIYYKHNDISDGAFYVNDGFVFTDCEPIGARNWFPCNDLPSDKALMELVAFTPSNVLLGSNGILADSVNYGSYIKYRWVSNQAIATYLIVITSRVNYNLNEFYVFDKWQNKYIPIRLYYNTGEAISDELKQSIINAYNYFSEKWYPHPFDKNGFATLNSDFSWGGMENQTLTSLCPGCWDENLLIHEFAHQWFGDMVTCKTWADIWLNEGFATWAEAYWLERDGGYNAYLSDIKKKANYYLQNNPGYAIYNPSWADNLPNVNTLFNYAITYCKGACVVHLLKYTLGDSLFFNVINKYFNTYKYQSATIKDFFNIVTSVTGDDYNWFMEQWIKRPNHPIYENAYDIIDNGEGSTVHFKFYQTNTQFYIMPVKLKFKFQDLSDTTIKVWNNYNGEIFTFNFPKKVTQVIFDPLNEIVLKKATTVVGIEDLSSQQEEETVKVYPNPFNNSSSVSFKLAKSANVSIILYDILGNKVLNITSNQHMPAGSYQYPIQLNNFSSGVYILSFIKDGGVKNFKINYIK